jgi:hypothetical protein
MPNFLKNLLFYLCSLLIIYSIWSTGILEKLFLFIGTDGEIIPNYSWYILLTCYCSVSVISLINIIFYFIYRNKENFFVSRFYLQLGVNVTCFILVVLIVMGVAAYINTGLVILFESGVVNNIRTSIMWLFFVISLVLDLSLIFFQVFMFLPPDRFSPIWKNNFRNNKNN